MATINLLPWREKQKEQEKRKFYFMLGGAAGLSVAVIGMWIAGASMVLNNQMDRNAFLKKNIAKVDKVLGDVKLLNEQKQQLSDRINVIMALQQSRSSTVEFFDQMVDAVPDGIQLTSLETKNELVTLKGVAESQTRVSTLMNNLDNAPMLSKASLEIVEKQKGKDQVGDVEKSFIVKAVQKQELADALAKFKPVEKEEKTSKKKKRKKSKKKKA